MASLNTTAHSGFWHQWMRKKKSCKPKRSPRMSWKELLYPEPEGDEKSGWSPDPEDLWKPEQDWRQRFGCSRKHHSSEGPEVKAKYEDDVQRFGHNSRVESRTRLKVKDSVHERKHGNNINFLAEVLELPKWYIYIEERKLRGNTQDASEQHQRLNKVRSRVQKWLEISAGVPMVSCAGIAMVWNDLNDSGNPDPDWNWRQIQKNWEVGDHRSGVRPELECTGTGIMLGYGGSVAVLQTVLDYHPGVLPVALAVT
ncbi:hypothetical protein B0H10DRAFT_1939965 [Mycena sp. CBHHK59/15]|nr:hypothetical protein B0H10DRAFT_1939965 [Mycena sp. CBHHK59/15]